MIELYFIISLALIFSIIYTVFFRILPDERWQIFAVVPVNKTAEGSWHGVNITYYGLLTATGYTIAVAVLVVMLTAAGTPPLFLIFFLSGMLIFFIPSAKLMAYFIERKKHTLTVAGAVFVMFILAPLLILVLNSFSFITDSRPVGDIVFLASLITAYSFGEGFGRLACISFGCCYGKAVSSLPVSLRGLFTRFNFVYTGKTKKISYHSRMDGVKTVPVQAITSVLYTASGLAGLYAFLRGHYYFSFFLSLTVTQLWRFASEFLRADFRGNGDISTYQFMSLATIAYYYIYVLLTGMPDLPVPSLLSGLKFIWNPGIILFMIMMWIGCVIYTGLSSVTSSRVMIYVNEDKI